MIRASEVKSLINLHAAKREKFLFGVDFEMDRGFFVKDPDAQQEILWRVGPNSNFQPCNRHSGTLFRPCPISFEQYKERFDTVHRALLHGDSFLTNLTVKTPLETNYTLEEILYNCNSPYAVMLPDRFVCFSPEIFVRIDNGVIKSFPMKGTISGTIPDAEQIILNDYKESAEHYTVVDLIRSDLSRIATDIKVDRLRYIDRLTTSNGVILQVSSEISGRLDDDFNEHLGDILFELLPAGSVSGAPKTSTINTIRHAEQQPRDYYCGVFGYFDGFNLDSAVMIRFIESDNGQLYFRSGSGITINSTSEYEYQEVIDKIYLPFV